LEASIEGTTFDSRVVHRLGYMHKSGLGLSVSRAVARREFYNPYNFYNPYGKPADFYTTTYWSGDINYTLNLTTNKRLKMNFVAGLSDIAYAGNFNSGGGWGYALSTNIYYNTCAYDENANIQALIAPCFGFTYSKDNGRINPSLRETIVIDRIAPEFKIGFLLGSMSKRVNFGFSPNILLYSERYYFQGSAHLGVNFGSDLKCMLIKKG
jgi:hypothetical protein